MRRYVKRVFYTGEEKNIEQRKLCQHKRCTNYNIYLELIYLFNSVDSKG